MTREYLDRREAENSKRREIKRRKDNRPKASK
jgi:hypothetical protein